MDKKIGYRLGLVMNKKENGRAKSGSFDTSISVLYR